MTAPTLAIQEGLPAGADLAARMDAALTAGFDGLEVRDSDPDRLAELRAAGGPIVSCCPELTSWLGDFSQAGRAAAVERLRRQLDGLAQAGGRAVITPAAWGMFTRRLPPFDEPPRTPAEDRQVLVEGLGALAGFADQAGVVVLLEALNRYEDHMVNTLAAAASIVRQVGSPAVRVLGDTYHMNVEEADLGAALRDVADVLGAVHLSDSNRFEPGAGHLPFAAVVETLRGLPFSGLLSVECRLSGDAATAVPACGAFLRGLLDGWD